MLDLSDSRKFSRTLAALGLILGPLLYFVATLIDPAWAEDSGDYLAEVAAAPGQYLISGALWTLGSLLFIPGALGVMKLMRGTGVTLGQVGAGLIVIAMILFSSNLAFHGMDVIMAESADREAAVAIAERAEIDSVVGRYYMVTFLGGLVLGSILLAIALFRRKIVAIWSPVLIVASVVLGFVGDTKMLSGLSLALLVGGFAPLGQKIWSLSDDAWGTWQPLGAEPSGSAVTARPGDPSPA